MNMDRSCFNVEHGNFPPDPRPRPFRSQLSFFSSNFHNEFPHSHSQRGKGRHQIRSGPKISLKKLENEKPRTFQSRTQYLFTEQSAPYCPLHNTSTHTFTKWNSQSLPPQHCLLSQLALKFSWRSSLTIRYVLLRCRHCWRIVCSLLTRTLKVCLGPNGNIILPLESLAFVHTRYWSNVMDVFVLLERP